MARFASCCYLLLIWCICPASGQDDPITSAHNPPCEHTRLVQRYGGRGWARGEGAWPKLKPAFAPGPNTDVNWDLDDLTWTDARDESRSRYDLYSILDDHLRWMQTGGKLGKCADLNSVDVSDISLAYQILSNANLNQFTSSGDLREANLSFANLSGASLFGANLRGVNLSYADLRGAALSFARLDGAYLQGTDFKVQQLRGASLTGVDYEPTAQPPLNEIASATGLDAMTYESNPAALTELHKQFHEQGFKAQQGMTAYAIESTKDDDLLQTSIEDRIRLRTTVGFLRETKLRLRTIAEGCPKNLGNCISYLFRTISFNLTCRYGLSPWRPLMIVGGSWLVFSALYVFLLKSKGRRYIYLVVKRREGKGELRRPVMCEVRLDGRSGSRVTLIKKELMRALILVWVSMLFSLINTLNIDVKLLDKFNPWALIKRVLPREFDLQGKGLGKILGGLQTVISLFLIGLWAILMTHNPFD
jgi:hypothetical protein